MDSAGQVGPVVMTPRTPELSAAAASATLATATSRATVSARVITEEGSVLAGGGVGDPEALLGRKGDQPHVRAGDHQERRVPRDLGRVERGDRRVVDREELAVALVHVVGQPAAVPLTRECEPSLDPVAVCLEDDVLVAEVQGARNPR